MDGKAVDKEPSTLLGFERPNAFGVVDLQPLLLVRISEALSSGRR